MATDPHKKDINIIVWSGVDVDKDSESADQSTNSDVDVKNSLSLDVKKGERPSVDGTHSVTFGDGERGKRPPTSD